MNGLLAFVLPPATAFAGMRLAQWILRESFRIQLGFGFRFAFGLAVGMLVFSQAVLMCALAGVNGSSVLAWLAIAWGGLEFVTLAIKLPASLKSFRFQAGHLWLLLLIPMVYSWWVFGRLSTLEGTLEFDANAFWVFKAKILFLEQGKNLVHVIHESNLGYTHMDYPMLVPCLYTLNYGLVGHVDEFVNKVWPFWMMVALSLGVLSLARIWDRPRLLPIAAVTVITFLPASLQFIRNEGGTIPMVFYISTAALLMVSALYHKVEMAPAALLLAFAGCFSTKFEGVLFVAIASCALAPFCFRRGWLRSRQVWISGVVAALCLLPYLFFRLAKPVSHPESGWLHDGLAHPALVSHRFPQAWFMDVFARFFNSDFFHWQAANNHLQWIGRWNGLGSLVNDQLSVLPWLLLVLLIICVFSNSRRRLAAGVLSAVAIFEFTVLSFVISCLPVMQTDLSNVIEFACNVVGRYYYPFFAAWFLGTIALWFPNGPDSQPDKKPALAPAARARRR